MRSMKYLQVEARSPQLAKALRQNADDLLLQCLKEQDQETHAA